MATARALIAAIDAELVGVKSALLALATSPHLSSANLVAFHAQAQAAIKDQAFVNVILADRNGRQLLNTFRPFGEPLPTQGDPGGLLRVFDSGMPAFESRTVEGIPVLTVFSRSPVSGWTVAIGIPRGELTTHLWYSMARLFIAAFVALIIALGLAALLGRRLMR